MGAAKRVGVLLALGLWGVVVACDGASDDGAQDVAGDVVQADVAGDVRSTYDVAPPEDIVSDSAVPGDVPPPEDASVDSAADAAVDVAVDIAVDVSVDVPDTYVAPPDPCMTEADCEDGEICLKDLRRCSAEGECAPRPESCPTATATVCGCDLQEHTNSCEAHRAGVNVFSIGECGAVAGCVYDEQCPDGQFCRKERGCTEQGVCRRPPVECTDEWDPVWGCDQQNYANPCLAWAAGTNPGGSGDYAIPNACVSDAECGENQYCSPDWDCEGIGMCLDKPESCSPSPMDHPRCGCDSQTYDSYCEAALAGVAIWPNTDSCESFATACTSNSDCNSGELCARPVGSCEGPGICRAASDHCAVPQLWSPVCGCDGTTYGNLCEAHWEALMNVASYGMCPVTGCAGDGDCAEGEFCQRPQGECRERGECAARPAECGTESDPICGCDGQTYLNVCVAESLGVSLYSEGECPWTELCAHNGDCGEEQYCALPAGTCVGQGHCEDRPDPMGCLAGAGEPEPVCGCDGISYERPCEAALNGANYAHDGWCGNACVSDDACGDGMFCAREIGVCGGAGNCVERPTVCSALDEPVCGCDAVTYPNACYAQAAGVGVLHLGGCVGACESHAECDAGELCLKAAGDCDGPGLCTAKPVGCPGVDEPVCGCDGQPYSNACEANAAGSNVRLEEACPATCTSDADCQSGMEYCARAIGDCDGEGVCTDIVWNPCERDSWEPVCGCDGNTYQDACWALMDGVSLAAEGRCEGDDLCLYNEECPEGSFCKKEEGCRHPGHCTVIPTECAPDNSPVCSCNHRDYASPCLAWMDGQSAAYNSDCGVPNFCFTSADCAEGEYCWLQECEGLGTCYDRYQATDCEDWSEGPICGCDGVSYTNRCWASVEGVDVLVYNGSCEADATACGSNADCDTGEYCWKPIADCEATGVCRPRPDHCPSEFFLPVCGCNGRTYGNVCEAHYDGMSLTALEPCL